MLTSFFYFSTCVIVGVFSFGFVLINERWCSSTNTITFLLDLMGLDAEIDFTVSAIGMCNVLIFMKCGCATVLIADR